MKQALIIGDSWGVTLSSHYWFRHNEIDYGPNHADHIEFALRKKGWAVNNRCWGGSRNFVAITDAFHYLKWYSYIEKPLDLIIWFHTELVRDWNPNIEGMLQEMKYLGLDSWLDQKAGEFYTLVSLAQKEYPDTRWIIIGGHCPIRSNKRHLLEKSSLIIDNWRQELAGVECPECHTLSFLNEFEKYPECFPLDIIERELSYREQILRACSDRDIFFDHVHPSAKSMALLSDRIINFIDDELHETGTCYRG